MDVPGSLPGNDGLLYQHGSVAEFKGKWYLFYHNQAISDQGNLRSMCIDELHFNEDGSICTVTQTVQGLSPAGAITESAEYPLYQVSEVGAGGTISVDDAGNKAATNLAQPGAYCSFPGIDGAGGGRTALYIYYETRETLAKLRLFVNGDDLSLINLTGTKDGSEYWGCAHITVRLNPGSDNTIKLTGGQGEVRVSGITAVPFND